MDAKLLVQKENYYTPENEDAVEMLYALPPKTPSSFHSSEYSFTRLHPADLAMAEALNVSARKLRTSNAESFLADLNPAKHVRAYGCSAN